MKFLISILLLISLNCFGQVVSQQVPVGTELSYAGSVAPQGYLKEDGSCVSKITYSKLFSLIGDSGYQVCGATDFSLPYKTSDKKYIIAVSGTNSFVSSVSTAIVSKTADGTWTVDLQIDGTKTNNTSGTILTITGIVTAAFNQTVSCGTNNATAVFGNVSIPPSANTFTVSSPAQTWASMWCNGKIQLSQKPTFIGDYTPFIIKY